MENLVNKKIMVTLLIGVSALCADEMAEYEKKQHREMRAYTKQQEQGIKHQGQEFVRYCSQSRAAFNAWDAQRKNELAEFKSGIKKFWGDYIEPTNKRWVEYGKDRQSVCAVDFEKGTASVAVVVRANASSEQITQKLVRAITRTLTSKGSLHSKPLEVEKAAQHLPKPILSEQVIDDRGMPVTVDRISPFAKGLVTRALTKPVPSPVPGKIPQTKKIIVSFHLAPDHLQKRIRAVMPYITKYCSKYTLNTARVLATIHTESHFNPMAVSGANAIGLMQLVPIYGGSEAYAFVYGTRWIPREEYLYDPEKNIELGCAYIYLLKQRHFSSVKDTTSQRYCTIAAYNTGPKNVSSAFSRDKNVNKAITAINALDSAQEVYDHLIVHLPYAETRHYLAEVTERMILYK